MCSYLTLLVRTGSLVAGLYVSESMILLQTHCIKLIEIVDSHSRYAYIRHLGR